MTSEEFKKTLWDAANKLRGSVSAAEYKYPVLGLVFLKYVSDLYDAQATVIRDRLADPESELYIEDEQLRAESADIFIDDKTFFTQDNVFWVPAEAKFSSLLQKAALPDFAQSLDRAMALVEAENPTLKGVLYREFSRLELEAGKIGELCELIAKLKFDPRQHGSRDVFGEVYEYFLGQFALSEGARAGEFYTPKNLVALLVEILAPFKGVIYDPACGSGGMFVQSAKFKDAHAKQLGATGDLPIYGQEKMAETRRLCLMNLAVHGLEGNIGQTYGSSFTNDQHKTLRADYILANPPFNISDWEGEKLQDDPRWLHGIPPKGNANYAWLQHMLSRLSARGRAGIVLHNGSMSSKQSGEYDIRKSMVINDVVECMVTLPGQLFANTQIPACLWFLSKDKRIGFNGAIDRSNQILFIDARKCASGQVSNKQIEFTHQDIDQISQIYHRWRGTKLSDNKEYSDAQGICFSASYADILREDFVLSPVRYVGSSNKTDEETSFGEKMESLTELLSEQITKRRSLESSILKTIAGLTYEPQ